MLPANKGNGGQVSFSFEKGGGGRTELCFSLRAQPTDRIVLSNESRSPPLSAHHPLAHSVRGSQKLIMNSAGIFATESPPLLPLRVGKTSPDIPIRLPTSQPSLSHHRSPPPSKKIAGKL